MDPVDVSCTHGDSHIPRAAAMLHVHRQLVKGLGRDCRTSFRSCPPSQFRRKFYRFKTFAFACRKDRCQMHNICQ